MPVVGRRRVIRARHRIGGGGSPRHRPPHRQQPRIRYSRRSRRRSRRGSRRGRRNRLRETAIPAYAVPPQARYAFHDPPPPDRNISQRLPCRISRSSARIPRVFASISRRLSRSFAAGRSFLLGRRHAGQWRHHGRGLLRCADQHEEERPHPGGNGRFAQLQLIIHRTFDIASMARLSVGAFWPL